MKLALSSILSMCLVQALVVANVHADDGAAGLALVGELAQINGQALACQDMAAVARAKKLMLAHAPKTQRYGSLFEETTNSSYLLQVRSEKVCPGEAVFADRLQGLAQRLQHTLPATAAPVAPDAPKAGTQ